MQKLVIGPKSVLVARIPQFDEKDHEEVRAFVVQGLKRAGVQIDGDRVIVVSDEVDFTVIQPAEEAQPESKLAPSVEAMRLHSCQIEIERLRKEVDRWKMVANGGHGSSRLDRRLASLSIRLNELAVKMDANLMDAYLAKSAFQICGDLQHIATFLRHHLDGDPGDLQAYTPSGG